jgi:hypothetical protein
MNPTSRPSNDQMALAVPEGAWLTLLRGSEQGGLPLEVGIDRHPDETGKLFAIHHTCEGTKPTQDARKMIRITSRRFAENRPLDIPHLLEICLTEK